MLFLIFTHIDTRHHGLIIEEELGKSLGKFRLSNTGSTEEDKRTNRAFWILQTGTATAYSISDSFDSFVLPNHTLVEFIFQMQQFVFFTLQHLADRNTCPAGYNICNILSVYFFLNHGFIALHHVKFFLSIFDFLVQSL